MPRLAAFILLILLSCIHGATTIRVYGNHTMPTDLTTTGIPSPWTYGINLTSMQIYFKTAINSANAIQFQVLNSSNHTRDINFQIQNANATSAIVSGKSITYPNIFNYTNISFTAGQHELNKVITITNSSAQMNFTFKIQFSNVNYSPVEDGSINFYDNVTGERLWTIAAPRAWDSAQVSDEHGIIRNQPLRTYQTVRQAGQNFFIDLVINETNMTNWTYPIYVDPTTQTGCGTISTSGDYVLEADVSTTSTCFTITADNVDFNCAGFTVSGDRGGGDRGFQVSTAKSNITIRNCTIHSFQNGIRFASVNYSAIYNNSIWNSTDFGVFVAIGANSTIIANNTFYNNNFDGLTTSVSFNLSIYNNTVFNNTRYGILFINTSHSQILNNSVHSNKFGIYLFGGSENNSVINNSAYANSLVGFALNKSFANNVSFNYAYNNTVSGFLFYNNSDNNSVVSNHAFNNSQYGFFINKSSGINLSLNNATNNGHAQYHLTDAANTTFLEGNRALQTPAGALDINVSTSANITSLVGSTYHNFSNENSSIFFHNAINISIRILSNTSAGVPSVACTYSGCRTITGGNSVINITNDSGSAPLTMGVYYNLSATSALQRTILMANHNGSDWLIFGQSAIDTSLGSVRYDGISSFNTTFSILEFKNLMVNSTQGCKVDAVANFTNIQGAINNASNGDTIFICYDAGALHSEAATVELNKSVSIVGNQSGVLVNLSSAANGRHLFNVSADGANLTNLTLLDAGAQESAAVYSNASSPSFSALTVNSSYYGIYLNQSNASTIFSVTFTGNNFSMYAANSYHLNMSASTVANSSNYSVYISHGNGTNLSGLAIINASIGIFLENASNANISDLTVTDASRLGGYGVYFHNNSNFNIVSNVTVSNSAYGIVFSAGSGNNLSGTNVSNSTYAQYQFILNSNATFASRSYSTNTPQASLDINATDSSNVTTQVGTSFSEFVTDYLVFYFANVTNVSLKAMNLSDSGVQATGCTSFVGTCTVITNNTNILNITNSSTAYDVSLGIIYNASTQAQPSNIYLSRHYSGWTELVSFSSGIPENSRMARSLGALPASFAVAEFKAPPASSGGSQAARLRLAPRPQ